MWFDKVTIQLSEKAALGLKLILTSPQWLEIIIESVLITCVFAFVLLLNLYDLF